MRKTYNSDKNSGLANYEEKTEYMKVRRWRDGRLAEEFLKVGSYNLKKVLAFKYLGTKITKSNSMEYEILKRI